MQLTGYTDHWSVRPGEDIGFHVHCAQERYEARLVRLLHGDENPKGPGFKEQEVASPIDGDHPGFARTIRKGSYGIVDLGALLDGATEFTLSAWIWPTLPQGGAQGVLSWLDPASASGIGIFISDEGRLECRLPAGRSLLSQVALQPRHWHQIALSVDLPSRTIRLSMASKRWSSALARPEVVETSTDAVENILPKSPLLFGAGMIEETAAGPRPLLCFNGKIARPSIVAGARSGSQDGKPGAVLAAWDFNQKANTHALVDVSGGGRHGRTVNRPARAMTGPDWPDEALSSTPGPTTHDAIHFHDDDVADVGWPQSHRLRIPDDLPSGVYGLRLRAGQFEDHLPFFVCPPAGATGRPRLAVLMPTMSYLAYANESLDVSGTIQLAPLQDMSLRPEAYRYVAENGLKSTYDSHRDGSGICHGSRRRPIIDFRPKARCRSFDAPHQFAADLCLVDWLTEKDHAFDVLTDDLLHAEGPELLAPYRVVITGSHPEYWTRAMLDARDRWLSSGGRLMYLGGNGFYWVTGVAEDEPDVIEIRRYDGTRTWSGASGEETLSVSGERGGLWRNRGRPPQVAVGVGFSGQGFDRGAPYRRSAASFDPRWSWIFEGVPGETFGNGPSLVLGHGAAGFEVDRADAREGTPAHAVVLASSEPFTDAYQASIELFPSIHPWLGGSHQASGVRADLLLMPGPNDGAVFSTGSIIWSATLSAHGYDSDTSRITQNVLKAFLADSLPVAAAL